MTLADVFQTCVRLVSQPPLMRGNYDHGARAIKNEQGHIRRDHQCGLCGEAFRPLERCFALIGDESGMRYVGNTRPFPFNNSFGRYDFTVGGLPGWSVCQAGYQDHEQPPCDSAMLHTECFELFRRVCKHPDALSKLFRFTAWRKPWSQIPNLSLREARDVVSLPSVAAMCKAYGLRDLTGLPIEIMFSIWNNCPDALLWRYVLVMGIAEQLSALEQHPTETVALADILSWTRSDALVTSHASEPGSRTLVTIDSRGIRGVERLPAGDIPRYRQSDGRRYLVIRSHEPQINAICADGMMRLQVDSSHPDLFIADTPNIHDLPLPRSPRTLAAPMLTEQYCTINLLEVTGLTLFFEKGFRLVSVFGHTEQRPYAVPPAELLTQWQLETLIWLYVPLPKGEELLSLQMGYKTLPAHYGDFESDSTGSDSDDPPVTPKYYFDKKLAGAYRVGEKGSTTEPKLRLADQPKILVFKKRTWGSQLHYLDEPHIVGYPNILQSTLDDALRGLPQLPVLERTHYACTVAPFEDVVSATAFIPPGEDWCRGVLLEYSNGAQRSLGQCRIGHDTSVTVTEPVFVELRRAEKIRRIAYTQNDPPDEVDTNQTEVRFYNTHPEDKGDSHLTRVETLYLSWHGDTWKHNRVQVIDRFGYS